MSHLARILAAVADQTVGQALCAQLRELGYGCTVTSSGDQAIALAADRAPDLVLCGPDLAGPGLEAAADWLSRLGGISLAAGYEAEEHLSGGNPPDLVHLEPNKGAASLLARARQVVQ